MKLCLKFGNRNLMENGSGIIELSFYNKEGIYS